MWSQYDEDVSDNTFYKEIQANHSDIIGKSCDEGWIVCIPREGSLQGPQVTFEQILDHILIPGDGGYSTLNKKHVRVEDKKILLGDVQSFNSTVQILFEETFYAEGNLKYVVWCVDRPLFTEYVCKSHQKIVLETVHDCIDFLWVESLTHQVLEQIQELCNNFVVQHQEFECECLQTQKDYLGKLYSQCLQVCLKNGHLRDKSDKGDVFLENLKISVETYMHYCLGSRLINGINTLTCLIDGQFNKIIRNSSYLQLQDLDVKSCLTDVVTAAKSELNKINSFLTILDKINCLQRTFKCLHKSNLKICITSDDLLQIVVFCILKLNVNNWWSNLYYIKEYRFSTLNVTGTNDFILTTFEAALEFIRSNQFIDIRKNYRNVTVSSQFALQNLFDSVRSGNLDQVKGILSQGRPKVKEKLALCHPLCSCKNCEQKLTEDCITLDFNVLNDRGQSLLTFATIHDHCELVEFFLSSHCQVNSKDLQGRTPLHYAAAKGFQDVLLLLINYGADVNAVDGDKITPLYLACDNGHENCVKALIYSSPQINVDLGNFYGDTPLHLAAKWGYIEILKILIENCANSQMKNRRNKTALDFATNYYTRTMLEDAPEIIVNNNNNDTDSSIEIIEYTDIAGDYGEKPRYIDQFKKIDLLLKSIENNDLPLTCFYLGFNNYNNFVENRTRGEKCHPLCNCELCSSVDEDLSVVNNKIDAKLNVNTCNAHGYTPLHVAAKFGRLEILRLLLDSSASPNIKTYSSLYTPLHLAVMNQRTKVVNELLHCGGCKVDEGDCKGNTPLYYAAIKGFNKIVELLLTSGADCKKKNNQGKSVILEVEERMLLGTLKLLRESREDVMEADKEKWHFF